MPAETLPDGLDLPEPPPENPVRRKIKLVPGDFNQRVNLEILQEQIDAHTAGAYTAGVMLIREKGTQNLLGAQLRIDNPDLVQIDIDALKAVIKAHTVEPSQTDQQRKIALQEKSAERNQLIRSLPDRIKNIEARVRALEGR